MAPIAACWWRLATAAIESLPHCRKQGHSPTFPKATLSPWRGRRNRRSAFLADHERDRRAPSRIVAPAGAGGALAGPSGADSAFRHALGIGTGESKPARLSFRARKLRRV